jgi:hypothetical protein
MLYFTVLKVDKVRTTIDGCEAQLSAAHLYGRRIDAATQRTTLVAAQAFESDFRTAVIAQ